MEPVVGDIAALVQVVNMVGDFIDVLVTERQFVFVVDFVFEVRIQIGHRDIGNGVGINEFSFPFVFEVFVLATDVIDFVAERSRNGFGFEDENFIEIIIVPEIFGEELEFAECFVFVYRADFVVHAVVAVLIMDVTGNISFAKPDEC